MKGGWARSRTVRFEARLLHVDDRRPVPIRFTTTATYDDDGNMCRVDGAMEDRSERHQFEAERSEHELVVSSLFRDTAVGIVVGTIDERFLAVNPAFCRMLGYREDELLGQSGVLVTHPDDLGSTRRQIVSALASGRSSFSFEKRYLRKDGTDFQAAVTMAAVKNDAGEDVAGIAVVEPLKHQG